MFRKVKAGLGKSDEKKPLSRLEEAQKRTEKAMNQVNAEINTMGGFNKELYHALTEIEDCFEAIVDVPEKLQLKYEECKKCTVSWEKQVKRIEEDYNKAMFGAAKAGAAGIGAGVAVAAMGPTAAMGLATTFGVASTGTAISALSGAAATNAALAWLGGGALAAGGGGMVAGQVLLRLAGPVGWGIAGVALLGSGFLAHRKKVEQKSLDITYTFISNRDTRKYDLATCEIQERTNRVIDETVKLKVATKEIKSFGTDYTAMTEQQQYALGGYVNLMNASAQLLINPILGLQQNYTEEDYKAYLIHSGEHYPRYVIRENSTKMKVGLCNMLWGITLSEEDANILEKSLCNNKEYLESFDVEKTDLEKGFVATVMDALEYKYLQIKKQKDQ